MACMGPSMPSDGEINELFGKILLVITREKLLLTPYGDLPTYFPKARRKAYAKLRDAIKEILVQDACENF